MIKGENVCLAALAVPGHLIPQHQRMRAGRGRSGRGEQCSTFSCTIFSYCPLQRFIETPANSTRLESTHSRVEPSNVPNMRPRARSRARPCHGAHAHRGRLAAIALIINTVSAMLLMMTTSPSLILAEIPSKGKCFDNLMSSIPWASSRLIN